MNLSVKIDNVASLDEAMEALKLVQKHPPELKPDGANCSLSSLTSDTGDIILLGVKPYIPGEERPAGGG